MVLTVPLDQLQKTYVVKIVFHAFLPIFIFKSGCIYFRSFVSIMGIVLLAGDNIDWCMSLDL